MAKKMILMLGMILLACLTVNASQGSFIPDECCFHFREERLPKRKVMDYRETSSHCPKQGIILTMMNKSEFCVHPDTDWVKNITEFIDQSR